MDDYMFTVQVNNQIQTYDKRKVLAKWQKHLTQEKYIPQFPTTLDKHITQIINHFGFKYSRDWFKIFYGWKFK